MTELYQLGADLFQVHSSYTGVAYEGTQLAILTYCAFFLKMDPEQLQIALLDMIEKDNDSANFGIERTFIFSFKRDNKNSSEKAS